MPRPTIEVATPTPALLPALRELERAFVVAADDIEMDAGGTGELVEDADEIAEDGGDSMMLLLADEVAGKDVVELDAACLVKDCGGGA